MLSFFWVENIDLLRGALSSVNTKEIPLRVQTYLYLSLRDWHELE